jgi:hypothetical protein
MQEIRARHAPEAERRIYMALGQGAPTSKKYEPRKIHIPGVLSRERRADMSGIRGKKRRGQCPTRTNDAPA